MATMKDNTSALDALLAKARALPEAGGDPVVEPLSVTPSEQEQTFNPAAGVDGFSPVTVGSIQTQTKTATQNGTVRPDSGKYLTAVTVAVDASTPTLQGKRITPTEIAQTVEADSGYDGLSKVDVDAIDSGYVGSAVTRQAAKTVSPTESEQTAVASGVYTTGTVKVGAISSTYIGSGVAKKASADLSVSGATVTAPAGYYSSAASKSVATGSIAVNTPSINTSTGVVTASTTLTTAGYVASNPSSKTLNLTTQAAATITPSASSQTAVAAQRYTTGAVTVSAVPTESKTITENGTHNATAGKWWSSVTVNVPQSGGGGMNVQGYHGYATVTSTSYTATDVSLTVAKTGTYKVSWTGFRNTTSGTSGSQLYIGNTAYGSAKTAFINSYYQSVVLTGVSLTAGQTVTVRARARSTSYVMGVGNLIIEQTA